MSTWMHICLPANSSTIAMRWCNLRDFLGQDIVPPSLKRFDSRCLASGVRPPHRDSPSVELNEQSTSRDLRLVLHLASYGTSCFPVLSFRRGVLKAYIPGLDDTDYDVDKCFDRDTIASVCQSVEEKYARAEKATETNSVNPRAKVDENALHSTGARLRTSTRSGDVYDEGPESLVAPPQTSQAGEQRPRSSAVFKAH
ncbi:hypothetical protein BD410DRAFT_810782, partial [Rickenella mellea]